MKKRLKIAGYLWKIVVGGDAQRRLSLAGTHNNGKGADFQELLGKM